MALGGFKHGTTLEELTNAYLPLANEGKFVKSTFVKYITDEKGKIVYHHNPVENFVFRDDTSYLMTDMLRGCVNFGTSKNFQLSVLKSLEKLELLEQRLEILMAIAFHTQQTN